MACVFRHLDKSNKGYFLEEVLEVKTEEIEVEKTKTDELEVSEDPARSVLPVLLVEPSCL